MPLLLLVLGRPLWAGEPPTTMRVLLPLMVAFNVQLKRIDDPRWFWALLVAGNLTGILRARAVGPAMTNWQRRVVVTALILLATGCGPGGSDGIARALDLGRLLD